MHFYLKTPATENTSLIYLKYYISQSEGRFVYSTKQQIAPKDWNFSTKSIKLKRGRTDLSAIETKIKLYSELLYSLLAYYTLNKIPVTKEQLKKDFDKEFNQESSALKVSSFIDLLDEMATVKEKTKEFSKGTLKKYKTLRNNLIKYQDMYRTKLNFDSFLPENNFVEQWMDFCYNRLNHTDNTVGRSFGFIKTALLYGKGRYHNLQDLSHFKKFQQETDDIALTKEELFYYYEFNFGNKKYLEKARDIFCVGCFSGQRYSDYSVFDILDYKNGNIEKRAKKTKNKSIIPVDANPKLKAILEKYNWKLPKISDQKFRDYVKEGLSLIGKLDYDIKKTSYRGNEAIEQVLKKWQMVGSHTARRTFITLALEDGWSYKEIMTVAGIKKVETVVKYDKVNSKRLNKKINLTFG